MDEKDRKRILKAILDRVARARRLDSDDFELEIEAIASEIRGLPRDNIFELLDECIGRSRSRMEAMVYVLGELSDAPGAIERFKRELNSPEREMRRTVISLIASNGWTQFAPCLNDIILDDPDQSCRSEAIRAAGKLKQEVNLPALLHLAPDDHPGLVDAFKDYGREEGRAYLRKVFERPLGKRPPLTPIHRKFDPDLLRWQNKWASQLGDKIFAAWGLAKLRDKEAIEFVAEMLYDPIIDEGDYFEPGRSFRAAQALADVFGLPFEWNQEHVESVRVWWEDNKDRILHGR